MRRRGDEEGPQYCRESKTQIVRYTGSPAKITVTREQFEQMTADLLDETIRITRRTLEEAEEKYPGITQQISEVLLVGGSSKMPAVSAALSKEFGWEPKLADPDLAVAKGAALYAAGQTVRYVDEDDVHGGDSRRQRRNGSLAARGPVTDEAVRVVASKTGLDRGAGRRAGPADRRQRAAEGDRRQARGHRQAGLGETTSSPLPTSSTSSTRRRSFPSAVSLSSRTRWWRTSPRSRSRSGSRPEPARARRWPPITPWTPAAGSKTSGRSRCPAGSPINIEIAIDDEGTVHLKAVEPASNHEVTITVRISILSAEQVDEAKQIHSRPDS